MWYHIFTMIQGFIEREYVPSFAGGSEPKLLSASNIHLDFAHHVRSLHKHSEKCELLFVRYGSSRYVLDGKTYPIKEGDMIITNAEVLHDDLLEKEDDVAYYALGIGNLLIDGLPENHIIDKSVSPVIPTGDQFALFDRLFGAIYELIASDEPGVEETCHYLMMAAISLVLHLVRTTEVPESLADNPTIITDVRLYLDENYMYDISLKAVSEQFHISSYYLSHAFKEQTGYSLMNYVIRRRIGEAQTLLIGTNYSITDIAGRVGFANPNNFNVQFQKQVGLSPRQYRKMYVVNKKISGS